MFKKKIVIIDACFKKQVGLEKRLRNIAGAQDLGFFNGVSEGTIINFLYTPGIKGIIINCMGLCSSIAIMDALRGLEIPYIEVITRKNIQKTYLSLKAIGVITGLGFYGYEYALRYFLNSSNKNV